MNQISLVFIILAIGILAIVFWWLKVKIDRLVNNAAHRLTDIYGRIERNERQVSMMSRELQDLRDYMGVLYDTRTPRLISRISEATAAFNANHDDPRKDSTNTAG